MPEPANHERLEGTEGTSFGNRYVLISKVGSGGMGAVHKATDKVLKKTVAVKVLLPNAHAEAMMRFHREAKMAARLSHSNILSVYDFGQSESGELYLTMDFLEGESLADRLTKSGRMKDLSAAVDIFAQICNGLEHAHDQGILHRDIKPSNVMLTTDTRGQTVVKIVDFGLAKIEGAEQSLTSTGVRIGSPLYMSPEQALGQPVDHRSDLYSLGVLMYKTLTNSTPFIGESFLETLTKHASDTPKGINEIDERMQFPDELANIVERLLEKSPDDRFQTASEIRDALLAIDSKVLKPEDASKTAEQEEAPSTTPSISLWKRIARLPKRVKVFAATTILAIVIICGYPTLNYITSNQSVPEDKALVKPVKRIVGQLMKDKANFNQSFDNKVWLRADPDFTDEDMPSLSVFKKQDRISLNGSLVTGKDFSVLEGLEVQQLDLSRTAIKDAALAEVAKLSDLRRLRLDNDEVTDNGIRLLADMPKLTDLHLNGTLITDKGIESLRHFKRLAVLNISACSGVTPDGIRKLENVRRLNKLFFYGATPDQSKALDALQAKRADLRIVRKPSAGALKLKREIPALSPGWDAWCAYEKDETSARKTASYNVLLKYQSSMKDPEFRKFWQNPNNWKDNRDISKVRNPRILEAIKDPEMTELFKDPEMRKYWQNKETWDDAETVENTVNGVLFGD